MAKEIIERVLNKRWPTMLITNIGFKECGPSILCSFRSEWTADSLEFPFYPGIDKMPELIRGPLDVTYVFNQLLWVGDLLTRVPMPGDGQTDLQILLLARSVVTSEDV
jgi:hypothetical protein